MVVRQIRRQPGMVEDSGGLRDECPVPTLVDPREWRRWCAVRSAHGYTFWRIHEQLLAELRFARSAALKEISR